MPGAPASSSRAYSSTNWPGDGRDVVTEIRRATSARATWSGVTSMPSRPARPSMTTESGTTVSVPAAASGSGRYAVESVTTATGAPGVGMTGRLADATGRT